MTRAAARPPAVRGGIPRPRTATFIDLRSWVFWTFLAMGAAAFTVVAPLILESLLANPASGALAAGLWLLYGLVFATVAYQLELYERRPVVNVLGALAWGAVVAIGVSRIGGPAMHEIVGGWLGEDSPWLSAIVTLRIIASEESGPSTAPMVTVEPGEDSVREMKPARTP